MCQLKSAADLGHIMQTESEEEEVAAKMTSTEGKAAESTCINDKKQKHGVSVGCDRKSNVLKCAISCQRVVTLQVGGKSSVNINI